MSTRTITRTDDLVTADQRSTLTDLAEAARVYADLPAWWLAGTSPSNPTELDEQRFEDEYNVRIDQLCDAAIYYGRACRAQEDNYR